MIRLLASKELVASNILILFLSEWLRYELTTHHHTDTFQYGASVPNSKLRVSTFILDFHWLIYSIYTRSFHSKVKANPVFHLAEDPCSESLH